MLERVQEELRERTVEVAIEPENGVLRLPEQLLFESAAATLRPRGEQVLRELAGVLVSLLPCYSAAPPAAEHECPSEARPLLEAVLIEGHTDDRPIDTAQIQDNWTLAALRGANTFKTLIRFEPELDRLKNDRGQALIGVGSYEARRPVSTLDTPEARRLNRRIDLRFIVAAPSATALTTMQRRLLKTGRPSP
jgi:flagellar motor protein MotB